MYKIIYSDDKGRLRNTKIKIFEELEKYIRKNFDISERVTIKDFNKLPESIKEKILKELKINRKISYDIIIIKDN